MIILKLRSIKGQALLESCVVFIIFVLFLFGITGIWFWSNDQIIHRQKAYERVVLLPDGSRVKARVLAGTSRDGYKLIWPPEYMHGVYTPPELTEDDVLMDSPF